jgi:arylsulfatase A-like enzyme
MDKRLLLFILIIGVLAGSFYFYPRKSQKKESFIKIDLSQINVEKKGLALPKMPDIKKQNKKVILISLDTVKANDLGIYGYGKNTSAVIDNFAGEKGSIVFKNAYTPVPETLPAHISAFTGLYPDRVGWGDNIDVDKNKKFTTVSKIFMENGYLTAGFYSSTVFGQFDKIDLGLDYVDPPLDYSWSDRVEISASETNDKVFKWLDQNYKSDFFLWVHYYEAHNPYTPLCTSDLFSEGLKPNNPNYLDGSIALSDKSKWSSIKQADNDYLNAKYDEEIYCLDKEFNNLLSKIKSLGIFNDATIIIFGDHGESFDHQALFHGFRLYQSEVKVPLIIKSPLIAVSPQNNVSLLDITPTLVDYFKLKTDDQIEFDGLSLNKIGNNPNRLLYLETAGPYYDKSNSNGYGLVLNDSKFINDGRSFELYNLKIDPKEEENLIKKISPQDIKRLADLLKAKEN